MKLTQLSGIAIWNMLYILLSDTSNKSYIYSSLENIDEIY